MILLATLKRQIGKFRKEEGASQSVSSSCYRSRFLSGRCLQLCSILTPTGPSSSRQRPQLPLAI